MEERGDAGGKKAVGDEATPAGALHGFDFGQVARHVAFAAVVGAVGAGASIVLSLAVDFAGRLSGRFPWLLLALPVLGIASILLYRLLRLPVDLATDTVVHHEMIERANIDLVQQMTEMITCQRALQSASQLSKMYDQIMSKAATELGRV